MLDLLLLPIVDYAPVASDLVSVHRASRDLTQEEMHDLSWLLQLRVRMGEALIAYAVAIAGRPRVN